MHYNGNSTNGQNSNNYSFENPNEYEDQEIDLLKIFNILFLNKWILIGIAAFFTIVAVIYSLLQVPIYRSSGTLIVVKVKTDIHTLVLGLKTFLQALMVLELEVLLRTSFK